MVRRLADIAIVGLLLVVVSCNNTFDINGNYREEMVVYALLDCGQDTNFLRIQKTFLNEQNALLTATDPAASYYPEDELTVYLKASVDGVFTDSIYCQYVDGDTLGIEKPEGTFSTSPNILYRITTPIDSAAMYTLFIIRHQEGDTVTAQTKIVQPFYLYFPTRTDGFISYADTGKITYNCKQAVNGIMYDLVMHFTYAEKNLVTGDSTLHTLDWMIFNNKVGTNTEGNSNISYTVDRDAFFTFLAATLDEDPDVQRHALYVAFDWYAGGTEVYEMYLNMLANLGLNQDYISPEYTNVQGGLGLFSSRRKESAYNVRLSDATIDSLACGTITDNLGFASAPSNLAYPNCGL